MKLRQFQVDAFANHLFEGNPAAVCPLDDWLPDHLLQSIAAENNLPETAFFVPVGSGFHLRWFTPTTEVDFCGHATLASAHVLFDSLGYAQTSVAFDTRSGRMTVELDGDLYAMNFPARSPQPCASPQPLVDGLGALPLEVLAADDYLAVFESESQVRSLAPDFSRLRELDLRGVIATAPGGEVDFVSRFFAPKYGIDEDPVTGSIHAGLTPYWAEQLGKNQLLAYQASTRGGVLRLEISGDRVLVSGLAVLYLKGEIELG